MSIIVTLIVGLVALGLGFVAGKLYTEKSLDKVELQQQIEDSKREMEQYKEDVSANLAVTQQLMSDLKSNYDSLVAQVNATSKMLEAPRNESGNIPYFGPQTKELMATSHTRNDRRRKNEQTEAQPTDFTEGSSGLFNSADSKKSPDTVEGE